MIKLNHLTKLNNEELDVLGTFRNMKIANDNLTLELIRYMLDDLLDKYSQLSELRKDMQIKYFEVMGLIKECEQVRYEEIAHWNNELNLLFEYKYAIEEGLELINSGAVEQMLIEEERR